MCIRWDFSPIAHYVQGICLSYPGRARRRAALAIPTARAGGTPHDQVEPAPDTAVETSTP